MAAHRHPQILVASDLALGDVVVLGVSGWERDVASAKIAYDGAEVAALEAFAKAEAAANRIVDFYLVDVAVADGTPTPLHFREKFRFVGPSVRPDLGKQAARSEGDGR
jgi:sulfite reductase (NADPH) hemoprotein beta-component